MSAWKLGRLFGIDVRLHWSFLLLLAWVVYEHLRQGQTLLESAIGVFFMLAIFGCVLLHEFGHALTARRFGFGTRDITILPIGGIARLRSVPERPLDEFLIAAAGPAVNVAIAAAVGLGLWLNGGAESLLPMDVTARELWQAEASKKDFVVKDAGDFLRSVMYVNLVLVAFNLLPAFPMDGGRMLRAGLAAVVSRRRATRWAAGIGKAVCVLFVAAYFFAGGPVHLVLAALFIWYGADVETRGVHVRHLLDGAEVGRVMMTDFQTLDPDDTLERVAGMLIAGAQQEFPVVAPDGTPAGMLTRRGMLAAAQERGFATRVADVMNPDPMAARPDGLAVDAYRLMRREELSSLPVLDGGRLVGLMTVENLREYLMLREAFEGRDGRAMPMPGSELIV